MNKLFFFSFTFLLATSLFSESNITQDTNKTLRSDENLSKSKRIEKQVKEQMALEKEYAKKQSFAQGDEYDLKAVEINPDSLDSIPVIEPEYDFDMTDVYRDDL